MNIQGIGLEVVLDVEGSNQKQVNGSGSSDGFLEILQSMESTEEVDTLDLEGQCPAPVPLGFGPCDSAEKLLGSFGMETEVESSEVEIQTEEIDFMKTVDEADGEIEDDKVNDSVLDLTQVQTEQIAPIISMGEPILSKTEIGGVKTQDEKPVVMEENMMPSKSEPANMVLPNGEQDENMKLEEDGKRQVVSTDSVNTEKTDFPEGVKYDSILAGTHEKDRNPVGSALEVKQEGRLRFEIEKTTKKTVSPSNKTLEMSLDMDRAGTTRDILSSRGLTRGEDHKKTGDSQSLDRKAMVKQNSVGADKEPDLAERRIDTGETSGKPGSIRYFPGNKDSFPTELENGPTDESSEKQVFQPKLVDINQLATSRNELPSIDERSEIDKHELVRELSKSVESGIQGETSFVKVNLDPDKFGEMSIDLIKSPEGIRARITAEKDMIRNLLTDSTSEIAAIFEEKNMKLETMVIETKESSYSGNGNMSGNDNHHQGYFGGQGFNEGNRRRGYLKETPRVGVEGIERPPKTAIIEKERLYGNTNGNINLLV